jgi:uncharacterized Tic20 family protein
VQVQVSIPVRLLDQLRTKDIMNNAPTAEHRIWAVLSHLSAITLGVGILLPIIGWSEQRQKSNYVAFQCLQALGYQSLGFTIWALFSALAVTIFTIVILMVLDKLTGNDGNPDVLMTLWMIIFAVAILVLFGVYFILPIIAAIACVLGKDFHYPILGNRLVRYLEYDSAANASLNEDHEYHWVAAMGHFSIFIILWGMLAPLLTWIVQGRQSLFLKFQSIQTLIYQAIATVLFLGGISVAILGLVIFPIFFFSDFSVDFNSSTGIVGSIIFIFFMLFSMLIILIVPSLHVLGQWAGYRVLKGDDYRYPLIGRFVEGWLRAPSGSQTPMEHNNIQEKPV